MTEWRIIEDIFVPEQIKTIVLTVENPARIFSTIQDLLLESFRRTSPDFYEDIIKWDVSGDPIEFYGSWRIRDPKDARTTVWGIVTVQGKQSVKDKSGRKPIWLKFWLVTKIPYKTPIDKSIAWLYMKMFYAERKRLYLAKAKEHFDRLENNIRAMFGIKERVPKVEMAS
ncbi:MAG: hypothetical protein QW761_01795 [Candidatus Aenigmatarchaeota archaeon]